MMFIFFSSKTFSQQFDTLYKSEHYNYSEFFPSESARMKLEESLNENKILLFGNYKDTLKNGSWIYFYPNGNILAKGKYKNGFKRGKWKYYIGDDYNIVIFEKKSTVTGKVVFDDKGFPKIVDTIKHKDYSSHLINGQHEGDPPVRFLD